MPLGLLDTGGEVVAVEGANEQTRQLVERAVGERLADRGGVEPTMSLTLEQLRAPFALRGLDIVTRDAWSDGSRTVLRNACGSGFDLQLQVSEQRLAVTARYRPASALRGANTLMRHRFVLLAGQTLVHYPVLWRSSWRGRVPLHAGVLSTASGVALLAGPAGVGKSTVIAAAVADGGSATSDNLCCADGGECFGIREPLRLAHEARPTGRARAAASREPRSTHGRSEAPFGTRARSLCPDRVVVLERAARTGIEAIKPDDAARALVAGTYAAGELRRYWQFAATLALATGRGPAHPPIAEVASSYTDRLPCVRVRVGDGDHVRGQQLCGELL